MISQNISSLQYKLDPTPEPSDEDIESSDDEEDGFGSKKKEEEDEDPAASIITKIWILWCCTSLRSSLISSTFTPHIYTGAEENNNSPFFLIFRVILFLTFSEAKAMAEKAQKDALEMAQSKCVLQ